MQDIACRLAREHCPDIRVHLVSTPYFNASMAPNGMMQIWTGLLLRMDNEAQLAAVIGHEIGHYLERHQVERLRDAKDRMAFAQFLGAFGLVGALGQLVVIAGALAYTRDQERAADRIGVELMRNAGYDPAQAATVWGNLLLELKARDDGEPELDSPLFATHPAPEERQAALSALSAAARGGEVHEERWRSSIGRHLRAWLEEEVRHGRHEQSIALLTRLIARSPQQAEFPYARAEVLRRRARADDYDRALGDYAAAAGLGGEPPETYRGLGLIYRAQQQPSEANASFRRYLELAPNAPDALMIRSYMEESAT